MAGVSQETFALGVQMWKEANPGKVMEMEEEKTLEQGCSTTLVAALDAGIKGMLAVCEMVLGAWDLWVDRGVWGVAS